MGSVKLNKSLVTKQSSQQHKITSTFKILKKINSDNAMLLLLRST